MAIISQSSYWPPLVIGGERIDLAHLEPVILTCPTPGQPATLSINVRFSNHCFTEAFDPLRHSLAGLVMDHKRSRAFDPRRYELSKHLPGIMAELPGRKVHRTPEQRNYVYFATVSEVFGEEYRVYFLLKKATPGQRHHLELFVESADPNGLDGSRVKRPDTIRFAVLALKMHQSQPIRFAPR